MRLHLTEQGRGDGGGDRGGDWGGDAPPVALLHGLFGAGGNLGAVARRLSARRRVLSLDLRNHGASPHADGMAYADMAEDVRQTLAAHAALPAVVVGHSMGGKVAMRLALDHPNQVARLVVADIAPVRYPPAFRAYAMALQALNLPGLTRAAADQMLADAVPDPGVRAFLLQNIYFGVEPAWRIGLRQIAAALPDIEGWNSTGTAFTGPVLFMAGGRSDYIRPEHRPVIRMLFPAARFVMVKQAGHWIHADDPETFAAILEGFLPP